jgi:5-formyltetrahydrofolate cyclo-ligase
MVNKKVLRQVYLEKRLFLTQAEYQLRNELLVKQILTQVNFTDVQVIHVFLSIVRQKEIDTKPIITALEEKYPKVIFAVSKTLPGRELKHYYLHEETHIETNSWGIPEPVTGEEISNEDIDLVFVPLIACDKAGERIGYGGGYYDVFLSRIPQAKKIGLSISPLLDKIHCAEAFDIKLDACITPFEVHWF